MALNLELAMKEKAQLLSRFLERHFGNLESLPQSHQRLMESARYSLLQEGSKRFRPVLAMFSAEALGQPAERVLPFAAAVECIHTYSLIHDDLPAMDNDDFRRGQPTNHRKFDESTAILAGDALLTEAFQIIADHYSTEPEVAVKAVSETAKAAGLRGMVGGQVIDMASKKDAISLDELRTMHALKTGALIKVSAHGAAILCRAEKDKLEDLSVYAENLGLAFQVADDLLDYDPQKPEAGSYPTLLGPEKARIFLTELTQVCLSRLKNWDEKAEPLRAIARYNAERTV